MVICDIGAFNIIKCVPYASFIYKLNKISGKYSREIIAKEKQNCLNDCIVSRGIDNIIEILDYVLRFK